MVDRAAADSAATGLGFIDDGRSFAVFDYDSDGDADLVIRNRTGPQLRLLHNEIGNRNPSLAIRLTATKGNRDAIGARVEVETPAGRQVKFLGCGSGFLAQHSKELVFGLGPGRGPRKQLEPSATTPSTSSSEEGSLGFPSMKKQEGEGFPSLDKEGAGVVRVKVRVRWPSGSVSDFAGLAAGYRYHLVEGQENPQSEPLAKAGSAGTSTSPDTSPLVEPVPDCFSTVLVDPLPMPPLATMRLFDEAVGQGSLSEHTPGKVRGSHRYVLLWLWDAHGQDARATADGSPALQGSGLNAFLAVQGKVPSRLVLWSGGSIPPSVAQGLDYPVWRANDRFRLFCTTLLAYLFDYRREPQLPTGFLFEVGHDAAHDPAGLGSFRKLVKVYWGGAEAEEILRDASIGVKSGAAALPFPGRALLCSFRRDLRWMGAALVEAGFPEAAEIYLTQLVEANAADAEAQYNLALLQRAAGKPAVALAGIRAALAARPVFPEAQNLLAVLLMDSGRLAEARSELEEDRPPGARLCRSLE